MRRTETVRIGGGNATLAQESGILTPQCAINRQKMPFVNTLILL